MPYAIGAGLNFYVLGEDVYSIEHQTDVSTSLAAQSSRILEWGPSVCVVRLSR